MGPTVGTHGTEGFACRHVAVVGGKAYIAGAGAGTDQLGAILAVPIVVFVRCWSDIVDGLVVAMAAGRDELVVVGVVLGEDVGV